MNVDLLTEDDLTTGDLSKYDSIAVGIYTYRLRLDLLAANASASWTGYARVATCWSVPPQR